MMQRSPASSPQTELTRKTTMDTFVSTRKRKDRAEETELSDIKQLILSLKTDQDSKYKTLEEVFNTMKSQTEDLKCQNEEIIKSNLEIKTVLDNYTESYMELKKGMESMAQELQKAKITIQNLNSQVQQLERNQRSSMLEINNCPILSDNKLPEALQLLHQELGTTQVEIRQAFQFKKSTKKTILVEYNNPQQSQTVIKAVKNYNKKNLKEKLNTKAMGILENKAPIYVSESLTPMAKNIFFMARQIQKKHDFKYCWTSKGLVYMRKTEDTPIIQLNNKEAMDSLMKKIESDGQ